MPTELWTNRCKERKKLGHKRLWQPVTACVKKKEKRSRGTWGVRAAAKQSRERVGQTRDMGIKEHSTSMEGRTTREGKYFCQITKKRKIPTVSFDDRRGGLVEKHG